MSIRLRVATTNAPESMKRGLLRDRLARAVRVLRFYDRRRIDVGALQESGTYARRASEKSRLKALYATFNDFVNGRQVGNGVFVKRRRWQSRLVDELTIGLGDDAVHIPVVLLTHRRTSWQVKFYAVHKPTRRAVNANLRPVLDGALRQATRRDDQAGIPWLIAGDFNGAFEYGVELAGHGPDHIRGSKHFERLGQQVIRRRLLSDHSFLIADTVANA